MTFEDKIKNLNPNQHAAVEAIDGPVMVIAGPGTGKTEILSLRIGNIRLHADTDFGNILCLTFTEAAAAEMRQRLIQYFGPDAYKIQVSTFHSFCNLVIQENPFAFQQARELEPISEIERFRLLQQLIDQFDAEHPLKKFKGQIYYEWRRLNDLFMTMKKEHWSPVYMMERIEAYIERMRQDAKFTYQRKSGENNKGDFNSNKFKKEVTDKMDTLRAAVGEYDHFNALMTEQGKYDFEDMLLWVYDAFDKNPDLLADYQERFQYILVDEFQDTNGIQLDILRKLIDHEWVDRPNVFVVGDDDQAIYRFQGANVENLLSFYDHYQPEVILLQENYRSSQTIIDAARVLMQPVVTGAIQRIYGKEKIILGKGKYSAHDLPVQVFAYPTLTYENADIFHQVRRWHEEKTEGTLAILYPKHALSNDLAQALKGAGIPYHMARSGDVLQHPLITNLLDILTCIDQLSAGADNDDARLYRVLHLEYLDPRPYDLQKLILAYTASDKEERVSLYTWLCDPERLNTISFQDKAWIMRVADILTRSITTYHTLTLMNFVEWVMHHFGIMNWVLRQQEKFHHLYALKSFLTFIDQEASGRRSFTIRDLLYICSMMYTYKIILPLKSLAPPHNVIILSTLHGAKGLEFEKVIIKNSTEGEWEKKRGNAQKFSMPDNLVRSTNTESTDEADIQDQDLRRLLYVGMTRAKYDLALTFPLKKDDGSDLVRSKYISELLSDENHVRLQTPGVDENLQAEYLVALMSGNQSTDLLLDQAEIQDRVRNYVMNVSAINKYLECHIAFFYENILRIPSSEKAHMIFGSALHWALQYLFKKRYEDGDLAAGKDYLLRMYAIYMENHRHRFTEKEYDDFMTYGQKVLGQYYDAYQHEWSEQTKYKTEFRIRDTHISGVPVTGFIDRIDERDGQIIVYDYKTGKPENIIAKMKGPDEAEPEGGDYWRQMVFYDLLLQQDPRIRRRMTSGYVHALEPKKDGAFVAKHIVVSDADREIVTRQIVDTYEKIQNMEFRKGCGECDWCKMHGIVPVAEEHEEGES